jgi:hypothetical protein
MRQRHHCSRWPNPTISEIALVLVLQASVRREAHTVGQPVSAMYIFGLLGRAFATCTLVSSKNWVVQDAARSMVTFANHAWTFAI